MIRNMMGMSKDVKKKQSIMLKVTWVQRLSDLRTLHGLHIQSVLWGMGESNLILRGSWDF